ncbi:hypothetical protein VTI74DRAFT_10439 [Chaetomium olivicolor]
MATSLPAMAAQDTPSQPPPLHLAPLGGKRKLPNDNDGSDPSSIPKKRRAAGPQSAPQLQIRPPPTTTQPSTSSSYTRVYTPLLATLNSTAAAAPKYEIKTLTVLPSTSIAKHVDRALSHLGQFNAWDKSVLPGVVLLCAKSAAAGKLVTIAELVRRRIGEAEQKWWQYNVLGETVVEEEEGVNQGGASAGNEDGQAEVVEDRYMAVEDQSQEMGGEGKYFETIRPGIHEQAVQPARVKYKAHLTVLLSRVPLEELRAESNVSLQTNEQHIEYLRRKKMG